MARSGIKYAPLHVHLFRNISILHYNIPDV